MRVRIWVAAGAHVEELQQLSASRDTKLDSCAGNSTAECVKARRDLRIAAAEYLDAAMAKGGDDLDALSLLDRHFVFLAASQHADANDAWDNRDLASAQNGLKSDAAKKLLTANKDQTWGILRDPIILGAILYGGVGNAKSVTGAGKDTTTTTGKKPTVTDAELGATKARVPTKAKDVLTYVQQTGNAPAGYKGGRIFKNDGRGGAKCSLEQTVQEIRSPIKNTM